MFNRLRNVLNGGFPSGLLRSRQQDDLEKVGIQHRQFLP
jgi:hypothetical protein